MSKRARIVSGAWIAFDNGFVQPGGQVGVEWRQGATVGLSVFFVGGDTHYSIFDGAGVQTSAEPFTDGGLFLDFEQTGSGTWAMAGGTPAFGSGTLGNGVTYIDNVNVFSLDAGSGAAYDLFVNNLQVNR